MSTAAFVGTIMVDCNDIDSMVSFWSRALGLEEKVRYPNYVWLSRVSERGPSLAFQKVSEARQGKNRIHLDLSAEDPEAFAAHVIELGGSRVEDREMDGFRWSVLADPEGNVFCVAPADH
ncbi:MAG: VOC family protein [Acidimicrobiia bacterium]|nr:VOC family protein [Acidimicrobiia bacterium]